MLKYATKVMFFLNYTKFIAFYLKKYFTLNHIIRVLFLCYARYAEIRISFRGFHPRLFSTAPLGSRAQHEYVRKIQLTTGYAELTFNNYMTYVETRTYPRLAQRNVSEYDGHALWH